MVLTVFIKSNSINELSNFLVSNFGFKFKNSNEKKIELIIDSFLEFHLSDIKEINDYTFNFLNDHNLNDSTLFYQIVDLKDYNVEIEILKNNIFSNSLFKENVIEILKSVSKSLSLEIVLNFNETEFYLFKNGNLEVYFMDNR